MKFSKALPTLIFAVAAGSFTPNVYADYSIRCESNNKEYNTCRVSNSGYVRLERELSHSKGCQQGRSWDFNRRQIWVDKGCKAEFTVEDRYSYNNSKHHDSSSSSDAGKAVAAIAGIAILGAILGSDDKNNNSHNDYSTKYDSDNYDGSRHTSYMPGWVTGDFRGYNNQYSSEVSMSIHEDGRVNATVDGEKIHGYYNDDQIHLGNYTFDVSRTPHGFETRQHGDYRNTVRYHRTN